MMNPIERESYHILSGDICKTYVCHPNQKGHKIKEWVEFMNMVRYLIDMDSVTNRWGDSVIIV